MAFKQISVRKSGLVIQVRIFECNNSKEKVFDGEARMNSYEDMKNLWDTLEAKGFMPKKERSWWN